MWSIPLMSSFGVPDLIGLAVGAVVETSDCELVRSGFPTQPTNTWSSLAYCAVGIWLLLSSRRAGVDRPAASCAGFLIVLVGVGSVAYHGAGGEAARWLHDASFLWALGFMAACEGLVRPSALFRQVIVFGAALVGAAAVFPALTNGLLIVLVGLTAWAEVVRWPARPAGERRELMVVGMLVGLAGVAYLLGRTGSPVCEPAAGAQVHAVWHALSAVALGLWARVAFGLRPPPVPADGGSAP